MPKMYNKESAIKTILNIGDELVKVMLEKGIVEGTIGRGELDKFNTGGLRKKDVFTMALCKFAAVKWIRTDGWEMRIDDPEKPVVFFRVLSKIKRK